MVRKPARKTGKTKSAAKSATKKRRTKKTDSLPRFFIQKHKGRNLHYDFRLEIGGALKSWAIPKGPSLNPADKRLAMLVPDHDLSYGDFEGVIPEGNYGAGPVMLWDYGEFVFVAESRNKKDPPPATPEEAFRQGALKFELKGRKCRGRWGLIKMHKTPKAWLLVKDRDDYENREDILTETQPDSVKSGRTLEEIFEEDQDTNPDCAAS